MTRTKAEIQKDINNCKVKQREYENCKTTYISANEYYGKTKTDLGGAKKQLKMVKDNLDKSFIINGKIPGGTELTNAIDLISSKENDLANTIKPRIDANINYYTNLIDNMKNKIIKLEKEKKEAES